jgi:hypothetical protein
MARFFHWGHRGFGHHGFGHGGFRRWHRPSRHHRFEPVGVDANGDGDDGPPPPPPTPPFPFPPFPGLPPLPGLGEMEAERGHPRHGHMRYRDDQEVGLNDEPLEARGEEAQRFRRSGRWVRTKGKLILIGV